MRLLVLDYDYFFPTIDCPDHGWWHFDWGHTERWAAGLQAHLWYERASVFLRNALPLPTLSGAEQTFWKRFIFTPQTRLYVSESNVVSIDRRVHKGITEVHLFDAHHDAGYKKEIGQYWTCENWALWYASKGIPVHIHYPAWRTHAFDVEPWSLAEHLGYLLTRRFDDGASYPEPFDRVHLCRSGAWVPSWLDAQFWALSAACPLRRKPVTIGTLTPRTFDLAQAEAIADQWTMLAQMQAAAQEVAG